MRGALAANTINNQLSCECGAATLTIALILLFSLSLITFYSARVAVIEQKVSANEYRAKQAFEAAQAGIEIGSAYLNNNTFRDQLLTDADNDGLIDSFQANIASGTLTNNVSYNISYSNAAWRNNFRLIEITSAGWSDDKAASANLKQTLQIIPLLINPPDAGVTGRENITMEGNVIITNLETGITAKTGGTIILQGNSQLSTSDPGNNGIEENNPELQSLPSNEEFFEHFFGITKYDATLQSIQITCNGSSCINQDNLSVSPEEYPGRNIWITGDTIIDSNIGSENHPVVMIIDGNLAIEGDITVWGLIYITQNGHTIQAPGNGHLYGALLTENNSFLASGNLDIEYNNSVITPPIGGNGLFTKIAGTWRDF